jgi:D-alanine--poly(phosphoribitol) ligase subunit 1
LGEIESVFTAVSDSEAVALGWPLREGVPSGLVVFVLGEANTDREGWLESAAQELPSYMLPKQVQLIARWPLNANGKIDRAALVDRLAGGS